MLGINPSAFRYIITMNKWFEPQDNKYGNTSTPYIYYNNNIVNIEVNSILYLNGVYYTNTIRHEIAHVLLTYSLDNLYLRPLFNEGIARLVEHNGKGKHELAKILFDDVYKNYSTNDILSINKHFHTIGSAIIHYLYNLCPETIKNFIYCIRKHINELECVEAHITKYFNMYNFKSWLFHKNNIHDIADTSKDTVYLIHNRQSSKDMAYYCIDDRVCNPLKEKILPQVGEYCIREEKFFIKYNDTHIIVGDQYNNSKDYVYNKHDLLKEIKDIFQNFYYSIIYNDQDIIDNSHVYISNIVGDIQVCDLEI